MNSSTTSIGRIQRSARVLLGWLNDQQAQHILSGFRGDVQLAAEQLDQLHEARSAVGEREADVDQVDVISPAPEELDEHIEALAKQRCGCS